ncbi:iojap-like ribosome-associated protein [Candidatus Johnevansia muelleri]|uniref:Ribosomal silencing factor RsfS n=1 Tax=Candidatus Johnevansia muelleri TaxID=1495769 RepID=A0A078KB51_9GAMM|nr:iojap-like ribosome-associated protein [Candidatus Evansia muelleri]
MHKNIAEIVINALNQLNGQNIIEIDVTTLTNITDTMIIASGTSNIHIFALANNMVKKLKEKGFIPLSIEGNKNDDWILVDISYVIVHIMLPDIRKKYNLEGIWII